MCSRTPPGVRELKLLELVPLLPLRCSRTPPGVRELKRGRQGHRLLPSVSHPSRGA